MVEYGEDYTDAATVIEGMQTAYTAGKGYLTKISEDSEDKDVLEHTEMVSSGQSLEMRIAAKIDGDEEAESQGPSETTSSGNAAKAANAVNLEQETEQISDSVQILSGVPDDLIVRKSDVAQAQPDADTKTDEIVKIFLKRNKRRQCITNKNNGKAPENGFP